MCAGCVNNAEFFALNAGFVSGGTRAAIQRVGLKYFGKAPLMPVTDAEVDEFMARIGAPAIPRPPKPVLRVSRADPAPRRRKLAHAACECGHEHHEHASRELVGASA